MAKLSFFSAVDDWNVGSGLVRRDLVGSQGTRIEMLLCVISDIMYGGHRDKTTQHVFSLR